MADEEVVGGISGAASGAASGATIGGVPGAIAGGILGGIGGVLGGSSAGKARKAAAAAAARNMALWGQIKIPTIEEQKIILQTPDLMGQYSPEQLQYMQDTSSAMENAHADPATIQAQNETLRQLQEVSKGGLTEADKATSREVNRGVNQQSQARQKAILNAMASRGTLGSGMELAARLQGEQQSLDQASNAGDQLTQQAQARALQALGQQGQLSGQMRGQQFNESSDRARATDAINEFNARNRNATNEKNLDLRNGAQVSNLNMLQSRENTRANNANEAERNNKYLYQSQFQNQIAKTQGLTGAGTAAGQAAANGHIQQGNAAIGAISAIGNAGIGMKNYFDSHPSTPSASFTPAPGMIPGSGDYSTLKSDFSTGGLVQKYKDGGSVYPQMQPDTETLPIPEDQQIDMSSSANLPPPLDTSKAQVIDQPSNELDPRYKAAVDESRKTQLSSDLYSNFLNALESTGPGYKANRAGVDILNRQAEQPIQDYQQLEKQDKEKSAAKRQAMENEKNNLELDKIRRDKGLSDQLDNPTSSISQNLASTILTKTKKLGMNLDENTIKSMSANQLKSALPWIQDDYKNSVDAEDKRLERESRERIAHEKEASEEKRTKMTLNAKSQENSTKRETGRTEGEKAADKDYAKIYNQFTSPQGKTAALQSISKMEKLADEMEKDTGMVQAGGGRIASVLPDVLRDRDAVRRRDAARSLANQTLKSTFGAQLSDAEREAAAKEFYNDALPNKENAKILRQKISDAKEKIAIEDAKSNYFEKNGTLTGFTGNTTENTRQPQSEITPRDQQALIWANNPKNVNDPRAKEIKKRLGQ